MNNFNYDNNIISLEEDNCFSHPKQNKNKKQDSNNKSKTQNSFFDKIINSVTKIGQGLRNIMSMKINYEDEDELNHDLYNQLSNRFNNNEEISLIDAPSFMEESNVQSKSYKNNESNIMMISKNEINDDDVINKNDINNIKSFKNSFYDEKEENINTEIEPNNERKLKIKSTFLNKKRINDRHLENILEERDEEEKNEEENLNINISSEMEKNAMNKDKIEKSLDSSKINKKGAFIKINTYGTNKLNNSSMMSLTMRSLDNIKNEISKRREENSRYIKEMYNKNELKYDTQKEAKIREKILADYYKEKSKRIAEGKLKMEREKQKREEEFQKLKIRKESGFKFSSIQKKQKILSETKNTEIHFKPNSNNINNNLKILQKEEIKQPPNTMSKVSSPPNLNITFGNISNSQSLNNELKIENKTIKDNDYININKKIDEQTSNEEKKTFFGFNEVKREENNAKKENELKTNQTLLGNLGNNHSIINNENVEQEKNNTTSSLFGINNINNEKKDAFDNKKKPMLAGLFVPQEKLEERKEEVKMDNVKKQEDFFDSSNNLAFEKKEESSLFKGNGNVLNIFNTQIGSEKGGLFDQNNQVSKGINTNPLFNSNSLLNETNPFINGNNSKKGSSTNLFGFKSKNENNQNESSNTRLFQFQIGNNQNNTKSLFG